MATTSERGIAPRPERSALATPASNPRMVEKALASAADAVFLDLEDAVAPAEKPSARRAAIAAVRDLDWGAKRRWVRINATDSAACYRDLVELGEEAGERLDLLLVPKVNRPADVHFVDILLAQIETGRGLEHRIGLELQIETAEGVANCEAIAAASPRIEALVFGPGDYAAAVGLPLTAIGVADEWDEAAGGDRVASPKDRLLVAARAHGRRAIDGPYADYRALEGFRRACRAARARGFDGKWCIHPSQIGIANEVFSATGEEVAWARRVLAEAAAAEREGRGALTLNGRMIDAASVRMARAILARAGTGGGGSPA